MNFVAETKKIIGKQEKRLQHLEIKLFFFFFLSFLQSFYVSFVFRLLLTNTQSEKYEKKFGDFDLKKKKKEENNEIKIMNPHMAK